MLAAGAITRIVASLICMMLLVPACDPVGPVLRRFGLQRVADGVLARFVLCPGELVTVVSLRESGSDPDDVLWRIESDGERQSEFIVGQQPDGFVETERLSVTLLSSIRYVASVDTTDQIIASESFSLADLRSTEVLVAWKGEYLPPGQFEESGRELCA
jgi:hypothetical protein